MRLRYSSLEPEQFYSFNGIRERFRKDVSDNHLPQGWDEQGDVLESNLYIPHFIVGSWSLDS